MGHIVNAKSTRIGWSTVWSDQWYTENLYYAEYLHSVFRIRFYCIHLYSRRYMEKKGVFYSHFEIFKLYKNINVEIYFYDGKLMEDYEDMKFEFWFKMYSMKINQDPETRIPHHTYTSVKLLFLWLFWIKGMKLRTIGFLSKLRYISYTLKKYKLNRILKLYKIIRNKKRKFRMMNFNILLLYSLYIRSKKFIKESSIFKAVKRVTMHRRYYIFLIIDEYYANYGKFLSIFLSAFFQKFTRFININVQLYLTDNNVVNAKFLSRYIARKLQQKYPIKQLLNPIKKELKILLGMSLSITGGVRPKYEMENVASYEFILKKNIFIILLKNIKINYWKILYSIFQKEKTLFNLDIIVIFIWMSKNFNKFLIKLSFLYYNRKPIFICFYEEKFNYSSNKYLVIPDSTFMRDTTFTKPSLLNLIDFIITYLYLNKNYILDKPIKDLIYSYSLSSFQSSNINYNRLIKYNVWRFRYINMPAYFDKYNHLKSRNVMLHNPSANLIGYKMYLKGRFSRKQRAGHLWFSKGKTPLNTISAHVDYAFYTLSLANSAITVKVWLYKYADIENNYFYKILY